MGKKKDRKKPKPTEKNVPKPAPAEKDDSFNFGGLPERNLKKNLGC